MPLLTVDHVSKSFPNLPVLHDVSFEVAEGEIVCLLGPSGCGKTTLLRIVAGLQAADAGRVTFAGQDLAAVPVHRRQFGLMFQDFALFPHKDVWGNVAFGLRMQGTTQAAMAARVREMLALVKLTGYERRRVNELSGGEQQRVALARSLAPGPRLLMLDEPLGSLDRTLRETLMNELRAILKRVGVTALYVTHDQEEAFAIADRVIILRARREVGQGGRIEQMGAPQDIYRRPATEFVARFLGFKNLLPGEVVEVEGPGAYCINTSLGRLRAGDASAAFRAGDAVVLLVRPEAADVRPVDAAGGENTLRGTLRASSFRGSYHQIQTAHAGGVELVCQVPLTDGDVPPPGAPVAIWLDPAALTVLSAE